MDSIPVGRGMGTILPEAVKATGAVGVMLNHAECKLSLDKVKKAIARADEVGLATIVCADTEDEIKAIAEMNPNIVVAEPSELSEGILNVSKVRTGTVTMCRLFYDDGRYKMHLVVGEGKSPPKCEEAGWTQPAPQLPGLEIFLDVVQKFAQSVMCQHYIISYGDNTEVIKNFCDILDIGMI